MSTLARAQEIVQLLDAAGLRASTDPQALAPPCFLVTPPNLTYDTGCGPTLAWQLLALAPASLTADRNTWTLLDDLVDKAYAILPVTTADLITYVVAGKTYPAYIIQWQEAS